MPKDPESGRINLGCYGQMIKSRNEVGYYASRGKDALLDREKWWAMGKPAPVAAVYGLDPLLFMVAATSFPKNSSEYDHYGGIAGRPREVFKSDVNGLPLPPEVVTKIYRGNWERLMQRIGRPVQTAAPATVADAAVNTATGELQPTVNQAPLSPRLLADPRIGIGRPHCARRSSNALRVGIALGHRLRGAIATGRRPSILGASGIQKNSSAHVYFPAPYDLR